MAIEFTDANGIASMALAIDDVDSNITATSFGFTLCDSVYDFYPTLKFQLNDIYGQFNEYMAFVNGTKFTLSFGSDTDTWKTCSFRVVENSTPEQETSKYIGGLADLILKHDFCFNQTKKSIAYNDNISNIVKTIANSYHFNQIDIDNTLNQGIWYQPCVEDDEFITNYLLPYAYSTESNNSPFYCWIDTLNQFHFKNYSKLLSQNPIRTYYYTSAGTFNAFLNDSVFSFKFLQNSTDKIKNMNNRLVCHFDKNGNFIQNTKLLTDYPNNIKDPIPIKINKNCVTDVVCELDDDIESDETENNRLGYEINQHRYAINQDKVIIQVSFDRSLHSGQLIELKVPSVMEENTNDISLKTSGSYLIETCYHKWDGYRVSTILVCSKQVVKVTNNYRNYKMIVNR